MSYVNFNYEPFTAAEASSNIQLTAPTNVNIHPGYTSVSANWGDVNDATGYIVSITDNSGIINISKTTPTNHIYIDSGLEQGILYTMTISAMNSNVKGPYASRKFNTLVLPVALATTPSPPPTSPPPTSPVDMCSCIDNDSCTSCTGKPFCVNGDCQACDPTSMITTDSECYQYKYVCAPVSNGVECRKCSTDNECQLGYGGAYSCNMDTGACEQIVAPPTVKPKVGMIIGIIIGVLILLICIGFLVYLLSQKPARQAAPIEWPAEII